jgi:hypothetical protein
VSNSSEKNHELSPDQQDELLELLGARFQHNMHRHRGFAWESIATRLRAAPEKLWSLYEMERTGGEPDVVCFASQPKDYLFCDCSAESPNGRRSVCYDPDALASRKEHKPTDSALGMAARMGVEILTEAQYRELQKLDAFDVKTSSWVMTPSEIRSRGGALFCDRRYDAVFVYHNGAESYYAARGFRGVLEV